jgi:hypothetical protein
MHEGLHTNCPLTLAVVSGSVLVLLHPAAGTTANTRCFYDLVIYSSKFTKNKQIFVPLFYHGDHFRVNFKRNHKNAAHCYWLIKKNLDTAAKFSIF